MKGGQIVKEAFKLSYRRPEWDGKLAYKAQIYPVYVDKVDLCIACAASLMELLREWWTPTETMVESINANIEGIFDNIDKLSDESFVDIKDIFDSMDKLGNESSN